MNETKPAAPPPPAASAPPPPRADDADMRALEAFLRAHDPALAFPAGFDAARERRLLRYMRHPRLALLLLHHRTLAFAGAALAVALVAAALYWLVRARAEDPVLSILIRPAPVETPAAPLEAPPPEEDPTDRAEPLPFDDPGLGEPLPPEPDEPDADDAEGGDAPPPDGAGEAGAAAGAEG